MQELASNACISLEGDLSRCQFPAEIVVAHDETAILKRNTTWPQQDFIALQLSVDTVDPIMKQVLAAGLKRAILHVQIEQGGVIQFAAYDNFHPEGVITGSCISRELLEELRTQGIVRSISELPN